MSQLWKFQPNQYWHGWDETGLSIFSGQPIRAIVREVIQNSLDAKADDSERVKVKFELFSVQREMLPGADSITAILSCCLEASADESEDCKAEVKEAYEYSLRRNFPILSCTDFGTNGMAGPYKKGNAFYTYMNSKGSSPGDSKRAGSHGHGKDAPLVNSALRTIFASANYIGESGSIEHLAQGKCVFMSHFQDEDQFDNIGRWGNHNMTPVSDLNAEYNWINPHPDELGTTISVVGFSSKDRDWMNEMIGHALISYFPAFVKDLLEIELRENGNVIYLNSKNFQGYFASSAVKNALNLVDRELGDELDRTQYFVNSMMESRGGKLRDQQAAAPLGLVDFNIYVDDNAPRSYCLIRRNMKICEKLPNLQRIPAKYNNFAMVIECQTEGANSLIRSMEPSEHDRVEIGRLKKDKKNDGEKLWRQLREKFTLVMDQEALPEQRISGQVDFLAKFFPDLANEGGGVTFEDEEGFDGDRIQIKPVKKRVRNHKRMQVANPDDQEDKDEPSKRKKREKIPDGTDNTPKPTNRRKLVGEIESQRVVELDPLSARLIIRLETAENCYVSVAEVGLDQADFLPITSASLGDVKGGKIFLSRDMFDEENKVELEVSVERKVIGGYILTLEVDES